MDPGGRAAAGHPLPEFDLQTVATLQLQQPAERCRAQAASEAVSLLPDPDLYADQDQLLHDGRRTDQAGALLHHLPAHLPGDLCVRERVHQVHLLRSRLQFVSVKGQQGNGPVGTLLDERKRLSVARFK